MFGIFALGVLVFGLYKAVSSAGGTGGDAADGPDPKSLTLESLIDTTFAQADVKARMAKAKMDIAETRADLLDLWKSKDAESMGMASTIFYAEARNVEVDHNVLVTTFGEESTATYTPSLEPALSGLSTALTVEISDRYGMRAVEVAKSLDGDAGVKEATTYLDRERKNIDKAASTKKVVVVKDSAGGGAGGGDGDGSYTDEADPVDYVDASGELAAFDALIESAWRSPEMAKFGSTQIGTEINRGKEIYRSGTTEDRVAGSNSSYMIAREVYQAPEGFVKMMPTLAEETKKKFLALSDLYFIRAVKADPANQDASMTAVKVTRAFVDGAMAPAEEWGATTSTDLSGSSLSGSSLSGSGLSGSSLSGTGSESIFPIESGYSAPLMPRALYSPIGTLSMSQPAASVGVAPKVDPYTYVDGSKGSLSYQVEPYTYVTP
jgi:hypothetical protein